MKYEQIYNDVEMVQDETLAGESVAEVEVNYEEILANMYGEMQAQTEELVAVRELQTEFLGALGGLELMFGVMVAFGVLEFCWSCMRQWRKNVLKMGE